MAKKITRSDEKKSIFGLDVNGPVFFTSAIFIIISIALTLIYEKQAEKIFGDIQHAVAEKADWFFILTINLFLIFLVYLALGKYELADKKQNLNLKPCPGLRCSLAPGWELGYYSLVLPNR